MPGRNLTIRPSRRRFAARLNSGVRPLISAHRVLADVPWSFVAFERDDEVFLTFMRGGPVETDATVKLSPQEAEAIRRHPAAAATLVQEFLAAPESCNARLTAVPIWPRQG